MFCMESKHNLVSVFLFGSIEMVHEMEVPEAYTNQEFIGPRDTAW